MDVYQFPALVVVDQNQVPVAVLTEGDLARAIRKEGSLINIAFEPSIAYATREPVLADVDEEVSEALHRMLGSGLTVLPVVDSGAFRGIVLRMDLMQALLHDIESPSISTS